jgi:hypothetical protein
MVYELNIVVQFSRKTVGIIDLSVDFTQTSI